MQDAQKSSKIAIWAPSHNLVGLYLSLQLRHVSTIGKNLLSSDMSSTCPHNMVNFGLLTAEIVSLVWGTLANAKRFRVFASLLHNTLVVGVSQTLRRWTDGATYIRQGGHHVGHWPTFLVLLCFWNMTDISMFLVHALLFFTCAFNTLMIYRIYPFGHLLVQLLAAFVSCWHIVLFYRLLL